MIHPRIGASRIGFMVGLAMTAMMSTPAHAAAKIQHLISPGGIEAWFVQDATVPLVAMEFGISGGAAQDPADKSGVGNMVADLIDEGSGDLDSKTFHERLDRRAIELSFSVTREEGGLDDEFELFMQFSGTDGNWLGSLFRR